MVDLKNFCKDKNISPLGKKPVVIKRIMAVLEDEEQQEKLKK